MITKLRVQGFKTLRDVTLNLSPVTLLIGPNNAGKSNILKALELVSTAMKKGSLKGLLGQRGAPGPGRIPLSIEIEGRIEESDFAYLLSEHDEQLKVSGSRQFSISLVNGMFTNSEPPWSSAKGRPGALANALHALELGPEAEMVISFLRAMQWFSFSPDQLKKTSVPQKDSRLNSDGSNLAATVDSLKPPHRKRIEEAVRSAIPEIESVWADQTVEPGVKVIAVEEGGRTFSADEISEGVLLFIAIATATQTTGAPTLLGLEEIERGVHPRRIQQALDLVLSAANGGHQFILTTHSPYLLDCFKDHPEQVLIVERDAEAGTKVRPFEVPPGENGLSYGDLWFSGLVGGIPAR